MSQICCSLNFMVCLWIIECFLQSRCADSIFMTSQYEDRRDAVGQLELGLKRNLLDREIMLVLHCR